MKSSKDVTYALFKDFTEVNSPNYEADLKSFLQEMESDVRSSVKTEGRAVRQAHAKSYGLLRARVAVVDGLPPEYGQGIFANSAEYEAVVRFSNGLAHVRPDASAWHRMWHGNQDVRRPWGRRFWKTSETPVPSTTRSSMRQYFSAIRSAIIVTLASSRFRTRWWTLPDANRGCISF